MRLTPDRTSLEPSNKGDERAFNLGNTSKNTGLISEDSRGIYRPNRI
jgi:hypothetical protein